jgi:thioredoxin reductase (NADPH)
MSRYLAERIERNPSIDVFTGCEVREVIGDGALEGLIVENIESGERRKVEARALFVFIGAEPHTEWLQGQVALDDGGYILTGHDAAAAAGLSGGDGSRPVPLSLESTLPRVFAAGDVRSGSTQRVAVAVGDGAIAVRQVHQVLGGGVVAIGLAQTYVSSK